MKNKIVITNADILYHYCKPFLRKYEEIDFSIFDISQLKTFKNLFNTKLYPEYQKCLFKGIENWNTSHITNMSWCFAGCEYFSKELKWDTSNVTDMSYMFFQCTMFDKPVHFNTQKVRKIKHMFYNCKYFNQPLNIDVSKVIDMTLAFANCSNFNQDLSNWKIKSNCVKIFTFIECNIDQENRPLFLQKKYEPLFNHLGKTANRYSIPELKKLFNTVNNLI